ncbi:MAG: MbnH family di-heme enzyme [Rubrimonas sp.]
MRRALAALLAPPLLAALLAPPLLAALLASQLLAAGSAQEWEWDIPAWLPPPAAPADNTMTAEKVELGRRLFYDARLSVDGTVACASCHLQARGFADGRPTAEGVHGAQGRRNAMALGNVAYMPALTWANPLLTSLEVHALIPLFGEEPVEMGLAGREAELFARLGADPWYTEAFPAAFPDRPEGPSLYTITRALAAFQRTLITADSPYDRWKYGGDETAASDAAKRGEELFFSHRFECYHCHAGFNFSDNVLTARSAYPETAFHNTGLYDVGGTGAYPPGGEGLATHTLRPADTGRFRTPSLRNVAVSFPYMHDGSVATLEDAIRHYAAGGRTIVDGPNAGVGAANHWKDPLIVGFDIAEEEVADLIAFLESLTDPAFLANPAFADPWPPGHPASATRRMPDSLPQSHSLPKPDPLSKPDAISKKDDAS